MCVCWMRCIQNKATAKETVDTRGTHTDWTNVITCSDWPMTTLRCHRYFGYKKGDGRGCRERKRESVCVCVCEWRSV